jgi:predicted phage terminase large subunit-like protein
MDVAAGRVARLMVNMPPRHGKSETCSKYFPAWFLGLYPNKRVILSSYEADFAASWGRKVRDLIDEHGSTIFGRSVSKASSAADRWDLAGYDGGMVTAGVGGPITGRGAHLLLIDDPVKNAEEAMSKTSREKALEWYKSTAYSRLEPGGGVVLIQTRWHQDDLAGKLLQEMEDGGERWDVFNFPAIAEEEDALGRQPGQPLWSARYDIDALKRIKRTLGPYWWAALYQQRPSPIEGNLFRRASFRYFSDKGENWELFIPEGSRLVLKSEAVIFQTCDPAGGAKQQNDYFALGTWAFLPKSGDLLLLDLLRLHQQGPQLPGIIRAGNAQWKPALIGIEPAHIGLTLFQTLQQEGLPVIPLKPDTDKVTRSLPASARYESGNVYHRHGAEWLHVLEDELTNFPNAAHDDTVDVVSYAAILAASGILRGKRGGRVTVIG